MVAKRHQVGPPAIPGVCKEYGVDNVGTVPATLTAYLGIQVFIEHAHHAHSRVYQLLITIGCFAVKGVIQITGGCDKAGVRLKREGSYTCQLRQY